MSPLTVVSSAVLLLFPSTHRRELESIRGEEPATSPPPSPLADG
jgi:hypothetical protein